MAVGLDKHKLICIILGTCSKEVKNETNITEKLFSQDFPDILPLASEMWFRVLAACTYGILTGLGLVGNTLFCVVIWRSEKLHNVTNLLVSNLAVANLIFTLFHPPLFISRFITQTEWTLGTFLCKACSSAAHVTSTASFYMMALVAVDRWFAVFRKTNRLSKRSAILLTVLVWVISFALAAPYFYVFEADYHGNFKSKLRCIIKCNGCQEPLEYIATVGQYILPLIILIPCYTHLVIFLRTQRFIGSRSKERAERARAKKRLAIITLLAIVVTLVVGWSPLYVVAIIHFFRPEVSSVTFLILANILASVAVCLTPVLYLMNGSFREEFIHLLQCLTAGESRNDVTWDQEPTANHVSRTPKLNLDLNLNSYRKNKSLSLSPNQANRPLLVYKPERFISTCDPVIFRESVDTKL